MTVKSQVTKPLLPRRRRFGPPKNWVPYWAAWECVSVDSPTFEMKAVEIFKHLDAMPCAYRWDCPAHPGVIFYVEDQIQAVFFKLKFVG